MDRFILIIIVAFAVEQIFSIFSLGSYPYRYGIPIRKVKLPISDLSSWKFGEGKCRAFKIRMDDRHREVYLRAKYRSIGVSPFDLLGQVKYDMPGIVSIRMTPCSGLLMTVALLFIFQRNGSGVSDVLLSMMVFAGGVLFFLLHMINNLRRCVTKMNEHVADKDAHGEEL